MAKGKIKLNIGGQPIDWTDLSVYFEESEVYSEVSDRLGYNYGDGYSVTTGQILGEVGIIGNPGYIVVKSKQTMPLGVLGNIQVLIGFTPPAPWLPPYVKTVVCLGEPVTITIT